MSELVEINEDNCVLDDGEILRISRIFRILTKNTENTTNRMMLDQLFVKILLLNDLVKEAKKSDV